MTPEVDLDPLDAYLSSDGAPEGCMDLSELDGFMAGVIAGPAGIETDEWLALVWDGDTPRFASEQQRQIVLTTIAARFHEIAQGLEASPSEYAPVFWEDVTGTTIAEDWAAGFMQAVALRPRAWDPVLAGDSASLLIPIAAIAGLALPSDAGGDLDMPEEMLDRLIRDAESILPACVIGLREHWRARGVGGASMPDAPTGRSH